MRTGGGEVEVSGHVEECWPEQCNLAALAGSIALKQYSQQQSDSNSGVGFPTQHLALWLV